MSKLLFDLTIKMARVTKVKLIEHGGTFNVVSLPNNLPNNEIEHLQAQFKNENVLVSFQDYLNTRHKHNLCAEVLRSVRNEKDQLEKLLKSEIMNDRGASITIRSLQFMVAGVSKSKELLADFKRSLSSGKKGSRPRISKLNEAMEILKEISPTDNLDSFIKGLSELENLEANMTEEITGKNNIYYIIIIFH